MVKLLTGVVVSMVVHAIALEAVEQLPAMRDAAMFRMLVRL
ncbi:MAG: hypothetical protein ABI379_05825 [Rhodanobacter sp.]